jgi:hypothetical protein
MRIVSFLPAATEMIYLLGLESDLVGRSHECDYPDEVKAKPIIVDCALDLSKMTMSQIDVAVSNQRFAQDCLADTSKLRRGFRCHTHSRQGDRYGGEGH